MILEEAVERAGYTPGEQVSDRPRSPKTRALPTPSRARTTLAGEGRTLSSAEMTRLFVRPRVALPDRLDRGRLRRGRLGGLGGADAAARRSGAARRRRPLRHQRASACSRASTAASPTHPGQGQPDRHAVGDLDASSSRAARLHARHEPPLRRDRGHDHRRPGRRRAGQIKTGAPSRSDRVAKYNRLLRIEEAGAVSPAGGVRTEVGDELRAADAPVRRSSRPSGRRTDDPAMIERLIAVGVDSFRLQLLARQPGRTTSTRIRERAGGAGTGRRSRCSPTCRARSCGWASWRSRCRRVRRGRGTLAGAATRRPRDLELGFPTTWRPSCGARRRGADRRRPRRGAGGRRGAAAREVRGRDRRHGQLEQGVNLPRTYLPLPSIRTTTATTSSSRSTTTSTTLASPLCAGPRT